MVNFSKYKIGTQVMTYSGHKAIYYKEWELGGRTTYWIRTDVGGDYAVYVNGKCNSTPFLTGCDVVCLWKHRKIYNFIKTLKNMFKNDRQQ